MEADQMRPEIVAIVPIVPGKAPMPTEVIEDGGLDPADGCHKIIRSQAGKSGQNRELKPEPHHSDKRKFHDAHQSRLPRPPSLCAAARTFLKQAGLAGWREVLGVQIGSSLYS